MTVFAVAAAGIASTTVATIKSNNVSRQTTVASALIHDKIEELRALDPASNPADFSAGTHADVNNPMSELGEQGGNFTRSWQVNPNIPAVGVSEVLVTVTWNTPHGQRSLRASTFICRTASCT